MIGEPKGHTPPFPKKNMLRYFKYHGILVANHSFLIGPTMLDKGYDKVPCIYLSFLEHVHASWIVNFNYLMR